MNTNELPRGWRRDELGNICNLTIGKTPSRKRVDYWMNGNYPWATISDLAHGGIVAQTKEYITQKAVEETNIPLIPTGTILLSFKLSIGRVAFAGTDLYTNEAIVAIEPKSEQLLLRDYLFFYLQELDIVGRARQAVKGKTVNKTILKRLPVVLPPLPVQERIVEILQKADEIRRKRKEALEITDAILPAAFRDIFGDPESNPFGWPVETLGKYIEESRYGTSERTGTYAKGDPVLRIPNVVNRTINLSDLKYLEVSDAEKKKLLLRPGDILVVRTNGNKDYVGRSAVFDLDGDYLFASYLIRLRLQTEKLNPHYVVAFLTTPFGRREIDRNSRTSAGQYNISSTGLRAIRIPIPPLSKQLKFLDQYEQWRQTKARLDNARREADSIFHCLLSRAFTGELTAEWEAENAEWIAKRQSFYERLPQLVLLAFLVEKARRAGRKSAKAVMLVTALMKCAFLLQMEGNGQRRIYNFVPYHYGLFAKELYTDLRKLQEEGLVNVDNDTDEEKTRISLSDPDRAEAILTELPDDLKEDIGAVLDAYGDLDHNTLIKTVYEKYPAYARKSRLRKGASPKGRPRGRRATK